MDRKKFLLNGVTLLGVAMVAPSVFADKKDGQDDATEKDACTVAPSETEGPFPTHVPASLQQVNIVGDRTGVAFTINITVLDTNNSCNPLSGAIVDIWHCDKDGNYSEYGGTPMQSTDYTNNHFLRGRQVTNSAGQVSFTSIFPGWYTGRATHIHVHIYSSDGSSLLVTQISFPEGSNSAVAQVNAATAYGYTKGMNGYTYNANDNVFNNDTTNAELAEITGTVSGGFVLTHDIRVAGPLLGTSDTEKTAMEVLSIYPNPVEQLATLSLSLNAASQITVQVLDLNGRYLSTPFNGNLESGKQTITFDKGNLSPGMYLYRVIAVNGSGTFEKTNRMLVR